MYIKEAHPDDEWQMESNEESGVVYTQPTTTEERRELARAFVDQMDVETETLLDDIDNTIVKPTALGPVANTDTKLLIYGLFQKGRVLAQDGQRPQRRPVHTLV